MSSSGREQLTDSVLVLAITAVAPTPRKSNMVPVTHHKVCHPPDTVMLLAIITAMPNRARASGGGAVTAGAAMCNQATLTGRVVAPRSTRAATSKRPTETALGMGEVPADGVKG